MGNSEKIIPFPGSQKQDQKYYNTSSFSLVKKEEENYYISMNERIAKLEAKFDTFEKSMDSLRVELSAIRWWILGTCLTTLIGVGAIVVAFGQYQASWFQQSLDRNWEIGQKTMDKIDATMLRMERLDAEQKSGKNFPTQQKSK